MKWELGISLPTQLFLRYVFVEKWQVDLYCIGVIMFVRINIDERGLLFKNGDYQKHLKPGRYFLPGIMGYQVYRLNIHEDFITHKDLRVFQADEDLLSELEIIEVADKNIVLHFIDERIHNYLPSGIYAFWKIGKKHTFSFYDKEQPRIDDSVARTILEKSEILSAYTSFVVESFEKGLLFYDGKFIEVLKPGRYDFWNGPVKVKIEKVDTRQQQLEVLGQELLSKDRITLRLNFICQYKIVDPHKAILTIKSYSDQIYTMMQLVLRDHISSVALDELLNNRQEIANYIITALRQEQDSLGIEFIKGGIKDIILPGEIRDILNTVLIAEKKAQANIITRREETASTRSLLNTAKLMDDNPILYRLKEWEYLEKIADKIDSIHLGQDNHLLKQITTNLLD